MASLIYFQFILGQLTILLEIINVFSTSFKFCLSTGHFQSFFLCPGNPKSEKKIPVKNSGLRVPLMGLL